MFDKNNELFPIKDSYVFLSHCGVSPLYSRALKKELEYAGRQNREGGLVFGDYDKVLQELRMAAAKLLKTPDHNLAFIKNTSEGVCMVANGYRFEKGDQVISYVHEYPANYYPWKLQERRGVEILLLPDQNGAEKMYTFPKYMPHSWSMDDLEKLVSKRTRIIAISHVQFTSGFAADLMELGEFCRGHDIDLVVDAAQSLGALPLYPEEYNISAIISSGWKWLMGPIGTGLLYTSEKFRSKLDDSVVGAEVMIQGTDYLDHSWHPRHTAKRFEYSTSPMSLAAALETCITDIPLKYTPEKIRAELFRLQDLVVCLLDRDRFTPLLFDEKKRGTILSVVCNRIEDEPGKIAEVLTKKKENEGKKENEEKVKGVVCTERGGYLRFAPHYYNTDEEIQYAVELLNSI